VFSIIGAGRGREQANRGQAQMVQATGAEIVSLLQRLRQELAKVYGSRLKDVVLFGSWARGEADWESDVDVAVVLDDFVLAGEELDRIAEVITELSLAYDTLIAVVPIRLAEWQEASSPLVNNIKREATPV